jgi:AcrR family transcriptional regulator
MAGRPIPRTGRNRGPRRPYAPRLPPEERREQLLDAAQSLIVEEGYASCSIEAVARLAGVTRPVVYDHFPNMARLLAALIEREEQYAIVLLERLIPLDPGDRDPTEVVVSAIEGFLEAVQERPSTWRMILLPPDGTPAVVRSQVETNRANAIKRMEELVRWGLSLPGMPRDFDVELTARAIEAIGEEAGRLALTDPDGYTSERYSRFAGALMARIRQL